MGYHCISCMKSVIIDFVWLPYIWALYSPSDPLDVTDNFVTRIEVIRCGGNTCGLVWVLGVTPYHAYDKDVKPIYIYLYGHPIRINLIWRPNLYLFLIVVSQFLIVISQLAIVDMSVTFQACVLPLATANRGSRCLPSYSSWAVDLTVIKGDKTTVLKSWTSPMTQYSHDNYWNKTIVLSFFSFHLIDLSELLTILTVLNASQLRNDRYIQTIR